MQILPYNDTARYRHSLYGTVRVPEIPQTLWTLDVGLSSPNPGALFCRNRARLRYFGHNPNAIPLYSHSATLFMRQSRNLQLQRPLFCRKDAEVPYRVTLFREMCLMSDDIQMIHAFAVPS